MRRWTRTAIAGARGLAHHEAVAELLPHRPDLLYKARGRAQRWRREGGRSASLAARWVEITQGAVAEIAGFLVASTVEAAQIPQATPLAGALDPLVRRRIWRETRRRLAEESAA